MAQAKGGKGKRRKERGRESNKTSLTYRARMCRNGRICPNYMPYNAVKWRLCMCKVCAILS